MSGPPIPRRLSPRSRWSRGSWSRGWWSRGGQLPLDRLRELDVDAVDGRLTGQYGRGPFPVVVIGSGSGALIHLAAALGAPFLPQTTAVPVRGGAAVDDPMTAWAPLVRQMTDRNPGLAVHYLSDPAGTRLWWKRQRLSRPYQRFLAERLAPGAVILQVECTGQWPSRPVAERAWFQDRPPAGVDPASPPAGAEPAQWRPAAGWGWDPPLGEELAALADRYGHRLLRLVCEHPQQHSQFVADLHRWWYEDTAAETLLVASSVPADPGRLPRAGAVPFWLASAREPGYDDLTGYLEASRPYQRILLRLPGEPGAVPAARWRDLLERHATHHAAVATERGWTLPETYPAPEPLTIEQVGHFLRHSGGRYPLTLLPA